MSHQDSADPADTATSRSRAEFGFVDLLVIAAESWPLLLILPLIVGGAVLFTTSGLQPNYVGRATAPFESELPQLALDELLDAALGPSDTRQVSSSDNMITIMSEGQNADLAAAEVRATLEALSAMPKYSEAQTAEYVLHLKETAERLDALKVLSEKLQQAEADTAQADGEAASRELDFITTSLELDRRVSEVRNIQRSLEKALDARLISTADEPITVRALPRFTTAVLAAIGTGMALFSLLVVRKMWRYASQDPLTATKFTRISKALFVFGRR